MFAAQNYSCFLVFSPIFAFYVKKCIVLPLQAPETIVQMVVGLQVGMTSYSEGHMQKRLENAAPFPAGPPSGP